MAVVVPIDLPPISLRHPGRMIYGSKSAYCERYPDNTVVFNAVLITPNLGRFWHGDLDITRDQNRLKEIARSIGETVYVLREMDGHDHAADYRNRAVAVIRG